MVKHTMYFINIAFRCVYFCFYHPLKVKIVVNLYRITCKHILFIRSVENRYLTLETLFSPLPHYSNRFNMSAKISKNYNCIVLQILSELISYLMIDKSRYMGSPCLHPVCMVKSLMICAFLIKSSKSWLLRNKTCS